MRRPLLGAPCWGFTRTCCAVPRCSCCPCCAWQVTYAANVTGPKSGVSFFVYPFGDKPIGNEARLQYKVRGGCFGSEIREECLGQRDKGRLRWED